MNRFVMSIAAAAVLMTGVAQAQRRAFDLTTPRPIPAADKVWIEELTWMEVRDAMAAGKTTALIVAGSTEQNGPYVPTGKHIFVLRATAEAIARKLGTALVAPAIPFEPGNFSTTRVEFLAWLTSELGRQLRTGSEHSTASTLITTCLSLQFRYRLRPEF